MYSVDWIYIVVVVVLGLFGDLIILSVRRQQREEQRRQAERATTDHASPAAGHPH